MKSLREQCGEGFSFLPLNFSASCGEVFASSGSEFRPGLALQLHRQAQQMPAAFGDTPTARARNLRQQLPRVQALQQASHRRAVTGLALPVFSEQGGANIAVAKATRHVVAVQNCCEKADVLGTSRIKPAKLRPATTFGSVS